MKTKMLFVIAIVAILAAGASGFAFAQTGANGDGSVAASPTPPAYTPGGASAGRGMGWRQQASGGGYLHDFMLSGMADILGITPDELEAEHEAGMTAWDIASEQGFTPEQFQELVSQARTNALQQAVEQGIISQDQADWMISRTNQMWDQGYGPGSIECGTPHNGRPGRGFGMRASGRWSAQP